MLYFVSPETTMPHKLLATLRMLAVVHSYEHLFVRNCVRPISLCTSDLKINGGSKKGVRSCVRPISRSTEDAPSDHTQISIELLSKQDHKSERIGQLRSL